MTDTAPSRTGEPAGSRSLPDDVQGNVQGGLRGDLVSQRLQQVATELAADTVAVLLVDPSGQFVDTYAAVGAQPSMRERVRVRVGVGFAGTIAQTGRPVVIEELGPDDVVNHVLREHHLRSLIGVPLTSPSGALGVLYAGSLTARRFATDDVARLTGLAQLIALAIDAQLGAEERVATLALQRSLLPATPPTIAGLDIAARYLHAEGQLGGDWYDVFALPGQRVGLVMGDVAGHGFPAAVVMGRLRSALRAYSLEYPDPAQALQHLDVKIQHFEPGVFATVLYAVAEYPYHQFRVSSAGHPAPLVAGREGQVEVAPVVPNLPLGVLAGWPRRTTTIRVEEGEALVVFTDGLVERRPPSTYLAGLERLRSMTLRGDADRCCADIIQTMFRTDPVQDDTAVLVVRPVDAG